MDIKTTTNDARGHYGPHQQLTIYIHSIAQLKEKTPPSFRGRGVDRRENSIGRSVGRSGTPWTDVRSVSSGTRSTYIQYQGCPVPPPLLGT